MYVFALEFVNIVCYLINDDYWGGYLVVGYAVLILIVIRSGIRRLIQSLLGRIFLLNKALSGHVYINGGLTKKTF